MKLEYILLITIFNWTLNINADINSGCPSWGCLSSGSFSLSSGVPPVNVAVKWSTEIAHVDDGLIVSKLRGCVSDQVALVCSTHSGYVSLDILTGKQLWNYTLMNYPYLPVMDVFGDIIGMDSKQMVYIQSSGTSLEPIDISVLKPAYSLMLGNNSVLLLTSSKTDPAQVVTYNTDGVICGALNLRGNVNNVSGTFIPAGHPIIVGYRAYVITQFTPDVMSSPRTDAAVYRLYALDLWNRMYLRIKTAWYFNLGPDKSPYLNESHHDKITPENKEATDVMSPVVAYLRGIVYINIPAGDSVQADRQMNQGMLWGLRDEGDSATFVFKNTAAYGQMVVYDTDDTSADRKHVNADQTIWISSRQPSLINGYNSKDGSFLGFINISALANIYDLTSKLAITRQTQTSKNDVLVFGGADTNGTVYLAAVNTTVSNNSSIHAHLLWKIQLNDDLPVQDNVTWEVTGQIVNVAQPVLHADGVRTETWQLGVAAMVLENGQNYNKLHIKECYINWLKVFGLA